MQHECDSEPERHVWRDLVNPLIARDADLAALEEALEDARRGTGRVRVVTGDAGMGKTRLARELSRRAEERGCAALWGGCRELALPFLPFCEAIASYLATADVAEFRERLGPAAGAVGAIVPELSDGLPSRDDLFGAPVRLQLFEGVVTVLRTVAARSGALLVVEDVHWADASTRALIDFVARRTRRLPLLLVVTDRSDEGGATHPARMMLDGWRRGDLAGVLRLSRLTRHDVRRLVCARLDVERVSSKLVDMLVHRSEGVPYAVEELLEAAIRSGHVFRRDEGWQCSELSGLHLPSTLAGGIVQRLDRLEPDYQRVVTAAAVLGSTFDPGLLSGLTGLRPQVVWAALREATRARLVETDPAHRGRLRFRHALTYEAVRAAVPVWEATALHSRAADALAATIPPAPVIERSRHLLAAGRAADAAPLCAQAAELTSRTGAFAEAATLYDHALVNVVDPVERGNLLCERGRMLLASGDPAAAIAPLQEGVELLGEAENALMAKLLIVLGSVQLALGEHQAALDVFERARLLLETSLPGPDLALLYARLAMWHDSNLEGAAGLACADRALALAEESDAKHARAAALIYRGAALCELGRRDEGVAVIDRGIAEAMRLRLPEEFGAGIIISVFQKALAMRAGELSAVVDLIRNNARTLDPGPEVLALLVEAVQSRFLGDIDQCEAAALAVLDACEGVPAGLSSFLGRELLAWVRLQQGRLHEAEALLEDLGPRDGWWHRICGPSRVELAVARGGDPAAAANAARTLLERVPVLASDPFVARIVVPALLAAGSEAEAEQCVSAALGPDRHPLAVGAAADLAAYRGDSRGAVALYREAADAAAAAGYRAIAAGYRNGLAGAARSAPAAASTEAAQPARTLSRRELELLALLAHGKTDQQIAQSLVISLRTVRSHLDRIRDKTGRRRRPQLTLLAIELGLLDKQVGQKYPRAGAASLHLAR
ncbi:ATP-binding protein [Mycobacterium gordonae]|uniref:HTH luxR-type domain-containing protein n=1 Tax=Mycobacterium gordonae TaxID=1778 RepID=A0A1A6BDU9_MYCGO|nr:AAA family ATPase [Mycobacterium gordonae]MCQ4365586.1 AAA family ATPase [Mycobacterium gordonae]MCV7005183.1 AAA family ATPase [Mycobacterium gordonae]OBS00414.1 hypothetical protein A9W98_25355 [Mycobacterium gordonae]ODR21527.1 hypothetical protein BHQ23_12100 [Mycobacterium gordonae]ORV80811.1 hypothetical protein AWC08_30145 [Mycobacterium gordonae]